MPSISSSMENRCAHWASVSSGRDQSSGSLTTAVTKFSAPMSWSRDAISSASASVRSRRSGSWQVRGTKAPTTRTSCASSTALSSAGSVGSQPMAPSSVAVSPTLRSSVSTRSTGSCSPHPGTSQMPHEIGAPATRWMMPGR